MKRLRTALAALALASFSPKGFALAAQPAGLSPANEKQLDRALEHYYKREYGLAAIGLHQLFRALPETDLKRDTIEFYLASSLAELGFSQAAIEHWVDIVNGRRNPELVGRGLAELDALVRKHKLDDARLIDQVLFGNQFGDLPTETAEFVEYHQGIGELRRRFTDLGTKRLTELSKSKGYYGWKARWALAVEQLARGNDDGADKALAAIVEEEGVPGDVRNDARTALARRLYERKKYDEAFALYTKIDAPLATQDAVLLEKAWTKVAERDERRALGMVVGLGAPIYRLLFAPERSLIRAVALDRLCQFRAAHLEVLDFRRRYRETLANVRERRPFEGDPVLREAVESRDDLIPVAHRRRLLRAESERVAKAPPMLLDEPLKAHLASIYSVKLAEAEAQWTRGLEAAYETVADQLLAVDEQMTILDYEIGVGLFKGSSIEGRKRDEARPGAVPLGGDRVYYRFDGEYWSDEIQDFAVLADDRCLR